MTARRAATVGSFTSAFVKLNKSSSLINQTSTKDSHHFFVPGLPLPIVQASTALDSGRAYLYGIRISVDVTPFISAQPTSATRAPSLVIWR